MDNQVLWLISQKKSTSVLYKRSFEILLLSNNTLVPAVNLGFGNWSGPHHFSVEEGG